MDQVSRPLLVALLAVVALAGLWVVALRPKADTAVDAPIPPQVRAVDAAKQASTASDAANAKVQSAAAADGAAAAAPAKAAGTIGRAQAAKPAPAAKTAVPEASSAAERAVLRDMAANKVVVLLFWARRGADDRAVRDAVRGLDRHRGRVAVHVASITDVGRFESITRDVTVAQSPTTLVIDRRGEAQAIVGLTEPRELAQAVGDAIADR
jgi:hypothetical protein